MTDLPTLDQAHFVELRQTVRGEVYRRGDQQYVVADVCSSVAINRAQFLAPIQVSRTYMPIQWKRSERLQGRCTSLRRTGCLAVCSLIFLKCYPHRHVFRVVIFCNKHGLSPSVKAGGYGTGGWAINGDIVIDLSKIQDVDIEPPQQGSGGYTSLRDTALSINKGKARAGEPVPDPSGPAAPKRLIESDVKESAFGPGDLPTVWLHSAASAAVANFLTGPALLPDTNGEEPRRSPASHPRLGPDPGILAVSSHPPADELLTPRPDTSPFSFDAGSGTSSGNSVQSSTFSPSSASSWATFATTPEQSQTPPSDSANSAVPPALPFACARPFEFETAPSLPDPFAYIDSVESPMTGVSLPMSLGANMIWDSDTALLTHPLFAGKVPSHLASVPPYTHAYVSFGAGAGQKDVDVFTAEHPLEGGNVPYHIPLCVYLL